MVLEYLHNNNYQFERTIVLCSKIDEVMEISKHLQDRLILHKCYDQTTTKANNCMNDFEQKENK